MTDLRIGHGYDVHATSAGDRVILGGVKIAAPFALKAHSDGDVLAHAVIDALFGACALPDIGAHFPDTDPAYENADSLALLRSCAALCREAGYEIANVDATVVAQKPKLAEYIRPMRENLASAIGIEADRVNVKATTEEHLGFTGSGEGIAAHAVCLVEKTRRPSPRSTL